MDQNGNDGTWTVEQVAVRLVAAFRALPGQAVFSDQRRLRVVGGAQGGHVAALNWTRLYVADRFEALALLTWARCRADGSSVRERYEELGWRRSTAEKARRRALRRIAEGLALPPT